MHRQDIAIEDFNTNIFTVLDKGWMLLTGGSFQDDCYNPMTVSWGMMGTFWFKPVLIAGVRPQRHTFSFMENYETFTLCAFPGEMKDILNFCGANSGRDCNKIAQTGLTPIRSVEADAPGYDQAELIIECRKLYNTDLQAKNFIDKSLIEKCYPNKDFHRLFVGEVLHISGIDKYVK